jgi:N-acetylglucosamine-6-phosphate deacetylase
MMLPARCFCFVPFFRGLPMPDILRRRAGLAVLLTLLCALMPPVSGQPPSTVPPNGLRDNTPDVHALLNARIVTAAGKTIEKGTLVLRDGIITAVGAAADVQVPPDARRWDCSGKTIYPGLIDACSDLPADASKTDPALADQTGARYWNPQVVPQVRGDRIYKNDAELNKKLRAQGIVARLAAPSFGLLKGTSALVTTSDDAGIKTVVRDRVAQHAALTIPRTPRSVAGGEPEESRGYPDSPMGAFTLVRQALYDAQWYAKAWTAHDKEPSIPRPERNDALDALQRALSDRLPFIIDTSDELYFFRADQIGREFDLNVIVRGSGQEYRRLSEVAASGRAVLVPVNFPKAPNVATPEQAANVSLEDLMDWDLAPENAGRLDKAGVKIALTTAGLRDKATFLTAVRKAVVRGLKKDSAIRALTSNAAELLGADRTLGSLESGKAASFVITDGELFNEKTKILETWIDGKRYEIAPQPLTDPRGKWAVALGDRKASVTISGELEKLNGKLQLDSSPATQPGTQPSTKPAEIDLQHVSFGAARLGFTFEGKNIDSKGIVQVSVNVMDGDRESWMGQLVRADGTFTEVTASRTMTAREIAATQPSTQPGDVASNDTTPDSANAPPTEAQQPGGTAQVAAPSTQPAMPRVASGDGESRPRRGGRGATSKPVIKDALYAVNYPLGDFGREKPPEQPRAILFSNTTVWTSGPSGKIENANVVVENGKVTRIFRSMEAVGPPRDAVIIDCAGKQLSPGIIDCHSHIATDSGINESGQAITAEVRIGDFINPDDINIYRQLAGGVTSSNILHGSANPIGGQNQVIKLRWGAMPEAMKFANAPLGIKFALGENVKQSNWGERFNTRYPQTRMGVDQLIRDEFKAAQDYQRAWKEYEASPSGKLPPRRDLELDAVVEILEHKRWIHCHSYRQDEILALMRTCESFGVTIGSFQHILEGYKVADVMARHGATGSTFSDWWAYKFEVYDAIPYNGALMHNAGIVVSFNSDDAELARRLNLEAAKAVKYGGVPENDALQFVTLNPAKQLRIDKYTGSIEVGKDADIVVWNGSPLSALSRVEQTWIDGRKYFDRSEDAQMRSKMREMRSALVQRILASEEKMADAGDDEKRDKTKEMWPNEDVFDEQH